MLGVHKICEFMCIRIGRTSRHGLVAFASSLDTPGIMTRTVKMAANAANAMSGADVNDATCNMESTAFIPTAGAQH